MQGKIRWSLAKVARASAWQDWLWVGDHFERERERERERRIERMGEADKSDEIDM